MTALKVTHSCGYMYKRPEKLVLLKERHAALHRSEKLALNSSSAILGVSYSPERCKISLRQKEDWATRILNISF